MTRLATASFDWLHGEIGDLRREYERCFGAPGHGAESWSTIEHEDGSLRLLVQRPRRITVPDHAIIYFHGGGWIVGSPLTHADISGFLADRTGMAVFSVEYRLAPESPAPAPVIDGSRALSAVLQSDGPSGASFETPARAGRGPAPQDEGGVTANKEPHPAEAAQRPSRRVTARSDQRDFKGVFLCGDSAGAAIALAIESQAPEQLRKQILGVCSFYGCFGLFDTPSIREFGSRANGVDAACIERMWALAHDPHGPRPYSIEALAEPSGAPVYLLAAGSDPLRDDTLGLARAYRNCGRQHDLDMVAGVGHGFLHDAGTSTVATDAIARVSTWILAKCIGSSNKP